jgi:hypothetical protein
MWKMLPNILPKINFKNINDLNYLVQDVQDVQDIFSIAAVKNAVSNSTFSIPDSKRYHDRAHPGQRNRNC